MRKRTLVRIISFSLIFVISVFSYLYLTYSEVVALRRMGENSHSMNLYELDGSMNNISLALKKAVYSSSPTQFSTLAVELVSESNIAKNSLSQLPTNDSALRSVNKFLSQVGDYTFYLSKKLILGEEITENERQNLSKLSISANTISSKLEDIRMQFDSTGKWSPELLLELQDSAENVELDQMSDIQQLFADYPTLIYDGPFSDDILNKKPQLTAGTEEISKDKALDIVATTFDLQKDALSVVDETKGNIPCFNIESNEMTASVTKQGGFIVYMKKHREHQETKVSYEQAVETAINFIEKHSNQTFVSTYFFADEGVCTVNLAYKEGATVCYPDLIKVGVSLDNGEIVSVDALAYISNHHSRTINTPKYTVEEARSKLNSMLEVESSKRAIIPTDGNSEKHCYEFLCKGIDGEELLVYINVADLTEEKILILLKTDGGSLTM